jgi:acetyl-CoA carboxylase carboxyl transferase subunit alpha
VADAASALRLTAADLKSLGVIDEIVPEPRGGAQVDQAVAATLLDQALSRSLDEVREYPPEERIQRRYEKFRRMGAIQELAVQRRRG